MFEFVGTYVVNNLKDRKYVKIVANSVDEANDKLEVYLNNKGIKWFETEIIPLETVIE